MDLVELNRSGDNYSRHPWELARAEIAIQKMRELNIPQGSTILDVGCGDTYFINRLSSVFPNNKIVGVDIAFTPELITRLSAELPKNVSIVSALDEINFEQHTVSLVLLMDVIEHVPDDKALLSEILSKVKKASNNELKFLITVPAFQFLFSAHDIFLGHYRRYTVPMLANTLKQMNFKVLTKGYFFFLLFLARIVVKLLEGLRLINRDAKGIAAYTGGRSKTMLIKNVLLMDFKIGNFLNNIGVRLPGLSCFATCVKQL